MVKTRPCGTSVLRGHMLPLVIASADEAGSLPAERAPPGRHPAERSALRGRGPPAAAFQPVPRCFLVQIR